MGISRELHIGAYGEVINPEKRIVKQYPGACSGCNMMSRSKFCAECGGVIAYQTKEVESSIRWLIDDEHEEEFQDLFISCQLDNETRHIFISNFTDDSKLNFDDVVDLTNLDMTESINYFKSKFKNLIRYLETKCERVDVKFGVIKYYF